MRNRRHLVSVERFTEEEVRLLKRKVAKRDKGRCVLCDRLMIEVHEVKFRSHGGLRAKHIFQERYMACLCPEHHAAMHFQSKKRWLTVRILVVLRFRHHYTYPRRLGGLLDTVVAWLRQAPPALVEAGPDLY